MMPASDESFRMIDSFVETVISFVRQQEGWAIPVAFVVAFGESLCFLSIIWPGWAILTALAFLLAASGVGMSIIVPTIVSAGLGGVLGYTISYWVGHYFKDHIGGMWPFRSDPTLIPRGQRFFEKHGLWSVFLGHFVGPVRAVIPVVAGMFSMPQLPFQIANVSSAFIWAIWALLWPVVFVTYQDPILAFMRDHEMLVALLLFALAAANAIAHPLYFVPTLILFAFIGGVHLYAGGSFWIIFLAGAGGAFAGDLYFYRAGERSKDDLANAWFLNGNALVLDRMRKLVRESGAGSVIVSKLLGTRRALVPVAAGAEGMPLAKFAPASAVSALLWSAVVLAPGLIVSALSS
jgi:membrane protein DedA with SNARE-associated domain